MVPEVASNVYASDETFTICQDTLKFQPGGGDFLSNSLLESSVEEGRHSQKLQDSLTHSDSTVDQMKTTQVAEGIAPNYILEDNGGFRQDSDGSEPNKANEEEQK